MIKTSICVVAMVVSLTTFVVAETNTPLPSGTSVTVTTASGTVRGVLADSIASDWIAVREDNSSEPTFIRATNAIVRRESVSPSSSIASIDSRPRGAIDGEMRSRSLHSSAQISGHYIHGRPRVETDHFSYLPEGETAAVAGITYHTREAFTIGHFNRMKTPAWVAMRWTAEDLERSEAVDFDRPPFLRDDELPLYAQTGSDLDFATTQFERGHMARDADLEAWGFDAVQEGCLMSNICPQKKGRGHVVWTRLEDQHRFVVRDSSADFDTVWILSGPIFSDADGDGEIAESELRRIGDDDVAVPDATYKVIAWETEDGQLHMRAYVIRQADTDVNLLNYLVTVDEVEEATGLNFFWQLEDGLEDALEAQSHDNLWGF